MFDIITCLVVLFIPLSLICRLSQCNSVQLGDSTWLEMGDLYCLALQYL